MLETFQVLHIEEPDFGCEGRPEEAVPMAKITLRSVKDGAMTMVEIADGYLYQQEITEGSIIYQNDAGIWRK